LTPAQPREVLEVLVEVPGLRAHALEMRTLARLLSEQAATLPRGESDFTRAETQVNRIEELWGELEGAGIPEAVLSFLSQATREGATFEQYTTEVSDWLQERSLTRLLRIGFASDV
jgi:hypothetical protein